MERKDHKITPCNKEDINGLKVAFLQGVIMPNGEFVSNGMCLWIREDEDSTESGKSVALADIYLQAD